MKAVFGVLVPLFPLWPLAAICSAVFCYIRHQKRIEPERRIPLGLYILAVVVCGSVAGFFGVVLGIKWGCSIPDAGNLCGLVGFLVVGPISSALGILLVGLWVSRVRPLPLSPDPCP